MLLTLPVILGVFSLLADDSARNIYARIRSFYNNTENLPDMLGNWFFSVSNPPGFYGVTKSVLIKTIEVLHETGGWLDGPDVTRRLIFENIATLVAEATSCDRAGIVKFCNWCFVAAKGDKSIKEYFANPAAKYTVIDKVKDTISDVATTTAQTVTENVEYAITPTVTTARINPLIKWAIIGGVAFFVYKKIFK